MTYTCAGPHGADTVLMSLLIVRSVRGLITSVMTFQPMRDCFARHLSMLQNRHRFFILFFNLVCMVDPLPREKKTKERLQAFKEIAFCQLRFILFSWIFLGLILIHLIPLALEDSSVSTNPSESLLGWRYCDVILIFWYHNQEFSGHNDTKMTLQTEGWWRLGQNPWEMV